MKKKIKIGLNRPDFDKSRLRVYYGNIGEIITQEVLRKQEFEILLTRPVGVEKDYMQLLKIPKTDEEIKGLGEYYDSLPAFRKRLETRQMFIDRHKGSIKQVIEWRKSNRAFFGKQLDAFVSYLKKLNRKYIPDLIAKKDGKIYVIEVKSRKGALQFLKGEKLRGLVLAREFGFIPSLISFNLKIEAENFKMEELGDSGET
jgi:hypothetical protein